jgi:hypothetical protein
VQQQEAAADKNFEKKISGIFNSLLEADFISSVAD